MTEQLSLFPEAPRYPEAPGWKRRGTSRQAAAEVAPTAKTLRDRVLAVIRVAPDGLTADEAADCVGRSIMSVRPRVSELAEMNEVEPWPGRRRRNKSGKSAIVWRRKNR